MSSLLLFYRLIVRPLFREPVRTLLTLLAIALGVAVVLAIDLSGSAASGYFHSSMETLAGANDLENVIDGGGDTWKYLIAKKSIWVGESLGRKTGETLALLINDQVAVYTVRGLFPDSQGNASAIVMDISAAQNALKRFGRVDRILIQVPQSPTLDEWKKRITQTLHEGVQVRATGAGTDENRRMLAAFRWNLRLLSYIALIVGAFLIYNTISVSVVRRRAEIGIV